MIMLSLCILQQQCIMLWLCDDYLEYLLVLRFVHRDSNLSQVTGRERSPAEVKTVTKQLNCLNFLSTQLLLVLPQWCIERWCAAKYPAQNVNATFNCSRPSCVTQANKSSVVVSLHRHEVCPFHLFKANMTSCQQTDSSMFMFKLWYPTCSVGNNGVSLFSRIS